MGSSVSWPKEPINSLAKSLWEISTSLLINFAFLFGGEWNDIDDTPTGASKRITMFLNDELNCYLFNKEDMINLVNKDLTT